MTVDKGAVRALAAALPLVVPGHLTPFLTPELQEMAGAKIAAELERKGWALVSHATVAQYEEKARLLHAAHEDAASLRVDIARATGELSDLNDRATRLLDTVRGVR